MSGFEDRACKALRHSVEELDWRVRSRLTQARSAALEEAQRRRAPFLKFAWMPVGGVAAAALALLVWNSGLRQTEREQALSGLDDLEIIVTDENLEMMEELEFYSWLDTQFKSRITDEIG